MQSTRDPKIVAGIDRFARVLCPTSFVFHKSDGSITLAPIFSFIAASIGIKYHPTTATAAAKTTIFANDKHSVQKAETGFAFVDNYKNRY